MARPRKIGLDYFQHDTNAANDEKIEAMRALYGNDGYAFYFILLERIYRNGGILDVQNPAIFAAIARSITADSDLFQKMLQTALDLNLFNADSFREQNRLTSPAIERQIGFINNERERKRAYIAGKPVIDVQNSAKIPSKITETPPIEQHSIEYNISPLTPQGADEYSHDFVQFWKSYPRKQAKGQAWKAFKKLSPDASLLEAMLSAIERQKNSADWKRDGGRYTPYPASWLNGRRWEDEAEETSNGEEWEVLA